MTGTSSTSQQMGRFLSLQERYMLARSQLGFSQCMTFVIEYPNASTLPTAPYLQARLAALQLLWPHLYARIVDAKTPLPRWEQAPELWTGNDLVREIKVLAENNARADQMGRIMKRDLDEFRKDFSLSKPFLRVTRYTSTSTSTTGPVYLACTIAHELTDGTGALRLLNALLSPENTQLTREPDHPIPFEDTVNLRAPLLNILSVVFRKLLLPKLPAFVSSYFAESPIWPDAAVKKSGTECSDELYLMRIEPELLDKLSAVRTSKSRLDPPSIHSILKTAYTLALRFVVRPTDTTAPGLIYAADTPRSERDATLGHSYALGNYVSALSFSFTPRLLDKHAHSFWDLATAVGKHLKDPATVAGARQAVGMLNYVPNKPTTDGITSAEKFWLGEATSPKPYSHSWEFSNLGTTALPQGATDMAWCQPGMIMFDPIGVSALRHGSGMRLAVTWREGSVVERKTIEEIGKVFLRILQRLSEEPTDNLAELVA